MDRKKTLEKAFQRGYLLTLKNPLYKGWIEKFIVDETRGDVGETGDITSRAVIKRNDLLKAIVTTREDGIVAGIEETSFLYTNNNIKVKQIKKDGDKIKKGDVLLELHGTAHDLLRIERSALDLLQRMSGIATLTHKLIEMVEGKVAIAPTRKTQWRYLDKKAVFIGGGLTHRLALWDAILVKDAHLKALEREGIEDTIKVALERAWSLRKEAAFIEIEVINKDEALHAARILQEINRKKEIPCLIMFDNMCPEKTQETIEELKKLGLYDVALIEASGGITPASLPTYSTTGVDVVSLGYLTHSSHALDIKQTIL